MKACLSNKSGDLQWYVNSLIVPKRTDFTPAKKIKILHYKIPSNVCSAKSQFFIPNNAKALIGTKLFFEFLKADKINLENHLLLQASIFGYLVYGCTFVKAAKNTEIYCSLTKNL